jgi:hypothetical protein
MGTLEEGARNAVEVCMSVTKREHALSLDVLMLNCSIWIDDRNIMVEGKHLIN